jgi:hypothetical protein
MFIFGKRFSKWGTILTISSKLFTVKEVGCFLGGGKIPRKDSRSILYVEEILIK